MDKQKIARFNMGDLAPVALTFVVVGIILVYGLNIVDDIRDDAAECEAGQTYNESNNYCYNATAPNYEPIGQAYAAGNNSVLALTKIPDKLPLIATVAIAAIIIGLIFRFFMRKM